MKARESFFFGMIPVLFPILSDRCRNSVVFFNHCFTDTHLTFAADFFYCAAGEPLRSARIRGKNWRKRMVVTVAATASAMGSDRKVASADTRAGSSSRQARKTVLRNREQNRASRT